MGNDFNITDYCLLVTELNSYPHCLYSNPCSAITGTDEQDETGQTWCCMYYRIWS